MVYRVGSKNFTAAAISTAAKAGEWVKTKQGEISQLSTKSSSKDLVTEVDKGTETMIRKLLLTYFPSHAVLGEESVQPGPDAAAKALEQLKDEEYVWIIDPIDGTTNYVHGFPFYSVSIALAHRGELIVGVIYDPSSDEMFVAEKGKGAYLRGKRLSVSAEERLQDSLIGGGFPPKPDLLAMNLQSLQKIAPKARNIRAAGSAALHLAYVAAGRLSGFFEFGLNPWDVAAGTLIIQESGGTVTDRSGAPYALATRNIVASNGRIHHELIQALNE